MSFIRQANLKDVSRIAEIIITNYRVNFYPFFLNDEFYFSELNVLDMAAEYAENPEILSNTYVYDDGAVKGIIRLNGNEIMKLFVEPYFQSQGIGAELLNFAIEKKADFLWVLEYNKRGAKFYQKHGFKFTGERIIEDEWIPLLKMSLNPNVELKPITEDSPEKGKLENINEVSFPESQRTSIDSLLEYGHALDIIGIYTHSELVGFLAVRKYKSIRYLAYFAVCPNERSKGIGSKALGILKTLYQDCQIILEYESTTEKNINNPIRQRRRNFYLRNGFFDTGWYNYYDETEVEIASSQKEFDINEYIEFIDYLNSIIPDYIPQPYQKH